MKYADYPGIYHMVEIDPRDWEHLPEVPPGADSVNIDPATEEWLDKAGYIIGRLQRVIFYAEGVKETNWSVTRPVVGIDGVERRWVYLHYFKDGQPSINWLDPSFAGHAAGHRRRAALADRPGHRRTAPGRQRFPRRGEDRGRGQRGLVGGPPALGGRQPSDRQHGAQGRRVHVPGAQPHHRRHPRDRRGRRRPVLRLHQPARLSARAGHRRHRVPAPDAAHHPRARRRPGVPGARAAEPRRAHLRAGPLVQRAPRRRLHLQGRGDHRRGAGRDGPQGPHRPAHRPERPVQPGLHHQRHRVHHRDGDRGDAGHHRPGRHRRRGADRPDPPGPPAAGDVQRAAARGVRAVGLGRLRHAHAAAVADRRSCCAAATPAGSTAPHTT